MRILQVVTLLTPDGAYGGPARVALNLSAELQRRGHDVTLTAATLGYADPPTNLYGVRVRPFAARRLVPNGKFSGLAAPTLLKWFRSAGRSFDIVHIHFTRDLVVLPVALSARRQRIPYVLQTHGMVVPSQHPLAAPLDGLITRSALRNAKSVLYLTDQERRQLTSVAGDRLRLVQLGNGVPQYAGATQSCNGPEVLFAARLHTRKQPLLFVEMARLLMAAHADARFSLVGPDGGEGPKVTAAIAAEPRIIWEGPLAPGQMADRIATASVFVLPSLGDPYPMAVLEAMTVGIPVVVNDDCGLAPMVARTNCGIVATGNARSLAAAVSTILADDALAAAMGQRGRMVAATEFGMSAIADRLEYVYSQALAGGP